MKKLADLDGQEEGQHEAWQKVIWEGSLPDLGKPAKKSK